MTKATKVKPDTIESVKAQLKEANNLIRLYRFVIRTQKESIDSTSGIAGCDAFVGDDPVPYFSPTAAQKRLHLLMSDRYRKRQDTFNILNIMEELIREDEMLTEGPETSTRRLLRDRRREIRMAMSRGAESYSGTGDKHETLTQGPETKN